VEMSRGGDRGGGGGGGGFGGRDRGPPPRGGYDDRDRGPPRGGPPRGGGPPPRDLRRSEHRVIISGLPPSASWQDLKDFFRQAGDVIFSDVDRHGGGIVEFASKSDQEYAISKLDDTKFVSEYRNQGEAVCMCVCICVCTISQNAQRTHTITHAHTHTGLHPCQEAARPNDGRGARQGRRRQER
jgi:hypothetical protein